MYACVDLGPRTRQHAKCCALKLRTSSAEANAVEHVERLCSELDPGLLADRKSAGDGQILIHVGEQAQLRIQSRVVPDGRRRCNATV